MAKSFKMKYFGVRVLDDNDKDMSFESEISLSGKIRRVYIMVKNINQNKLKSCLKILDKYMKLHEIGKNEIIEKYMEKENMLLFIKDHFDHLDREEELKIFGTNDFQNVNIKEFVETIEPPDITIINNNNGRIITSLGYTFINGSKKTINIELNEKLKVNDVKYNYGGYSNMEYGGHVA